MNAVSLAPASAFPTTTRYRAEESSQLRSVVDQPDVHAGGDRHGRDAPPSQSPVPFIYAHTGLRLGDLLRWSRSHVDDVASSLLPTRAS